MITPDCPHCGAHLDYGGIVDGIGDYGDSTCDVWICHDCDVEIELDCYDDPDSLYGDDEIIEAMPPEDDQPYSPTARDMDDIPF